MQIKNREPTAIQGNCKHRIKIQERYLLGYLLGFFFATRCIYSIVRLSHLHQLKLNACLGCQRKCE